MPLLLILALSQEIINAVETIVEMDPIDKTVSVIRMDSISIPLEMEIKTSMVLDLTTKSIQQNLSKLLPNLLQVITQSTDN